MSPPTLSLRVHTEAIDLIYPAIFGDTKQDELPAERGLVTVGYPSMVFHGPARDCQRSKMRHVKVKEMACNETGRSLNS